MEPQYSPYRDPNEVRAEFPLGQRVAYSPKGVAVFANPRKVFSGLVYMVRFEDSAVHDIGTVPGCVLAARSREKLTLWILKRVAEIRREQIVSMRESKAT